MSKETLPLNGILDTYNDGRKCPRLVIACPVSLCLTGGTAVEATLYDISLTGLQVWIGVKEAGVIEIQPDSNIKKNTSPLEIRFQLTINGRIQNMFFLAKPLHLKKIHDDYLAIGMQITELDKKIAGLLAGYIETSLGKG